MRSCCIVFVVLVVSFSSILCDSLDDDRADIAFKSFITKFWVNNTLQDSYPNTGERPQYWISAMGFDTILDSAERHIKKGQDKQYYFDLIEAFYNMIDKNGWYRPFFDDMNWMALGLLRAYALNKNPKYLNKATELYNIIAYQWDETCCCPKDKGNTTCVTGGLWWNLEHTQKATAANAGPVILASRLYEITKNNDQREFAKKVYTYWWNNMVDPISHQVCDNIEAETAEKRWWKYTYNEGLMIGAGLALERIFDDSTYLQNSYKIAEFVFGNEVTSENVLYDKDGECSGDCQEFKGIAFRYLALLYARDRSHSRLKKILDDSAASIWNRARNIEEQTFATNWSGPAPLTGSKITQATMNAATMALNIHAATMSQMIN